MNVQTIYSEWKEYGRLPDINAFIDFTIAGKTLELEFLSKLYRISNKTLDFSSAFEDENLLPLLLENIPSTWNDDISAAISVSADILRTYADLRVFLKITEGDIDKQRIIERRSSTSSIDALTEQMTRLSLAKSADVYIAERSKRSIGIMSEMTGSRVPMEWVQQCASTLIVQNQYQQVDVSKYVLLREQSDRHIHNVNASVISFLQQLKEDFKDDNGLKRTITWQFSHDSMFAIHIQNFKKAAIDLCPDTPYEFIVFACAIGIPIHELMKTRDIITTWKSGRFKIFNRDNVVKVLLRRRFLSDTSDVEVNQLLREYKKNISDFRVQTDTNDIDMYFYKRFYSYPSFDEMEHLEERIRKNTRIWF